MADADPEEQRSWAVPPALDDERLDRAIATITGLSRREVGEMIDAGRVRLGRTAVTSRSRKVKAGQRITATGPFGDGPEVAPAADPGVDVPVVYADENLIVVDKPAGVVVHPGAGHREATLIHGLLARFPDLEALATGATTHRPGIVHRLDKGTSGLLVVARNEPARRRLAAQLADRTMTREYIALVAGDVESDAGLVDAPLGRSDTDPTRFRVQAGGRPARTRYEVERRFAEPVPLTLLRCRLETGRTHQIRVHLTAIGHPVVGDDRYGGRSPRSPGLALPPGRTFLHARSLGFIHPNSEERVHFEAPLPPDLLDLLATISQPDGPHA